MKVSMNLPCSVVSSKTPRARPAKASPHDTELGHGGEEVVDVLLGDAVPDEDEDRAVVRTDVLAHGEGRAGDRLEGRPVHDRQPEARDEKDARQEGGGRDEEGGAQWEEGVDDAEGDPAEHEGALEDDVEDRKGPGLNPLRDDLTGGDGQGRRRPDPARARDDEHGSRGPACRPGDEHDEGDPVGEGGPRDEGVEVPTALQAGKEDGSRHRAHPAQREEEPVAEGRGVEVTGGEERQQGAERRGRRDVEGGARPRRPAVPACSRRTATPRTASRGSSRRPSRRGWRA